MEDASRRIFYGAQFPALLGSFVKLSLGRLQGRVPEGKNPWRVRPPYFAPGLGKLSADQLALFPVSPTVGSGLFLIF